LKEKLVTISLFVMFALFIAAFFIAKYTDVFTIVQDGVVSGVKQVENY